MNTVHNIIRPFILFALCGLALSGIADTQKSQIENRVDNMFKLLNESSGAKQVINGFSTEARETRKQAIDLYDKARESLNSGNDDAAAKLLGQSAKLMFEAIKLSTPTAMIEEKIIVDYGRRKKSVIALKDAFNRISDENNEQDSKAKVNKQLEKLVRQADRLLNNGASSEARTEIDKAYHLLKVSIEAIRSGQTLVRSLNFDSPKEEYLYEIDRNDTHSMLVGLLTDEKQQSVSIKNNIVKFVEAANILRKQAESYAAENAFEQAIEILEQSTRQLVRAIRSAGIYIPG